jgi:LPPG:FO 2-phospho-L-lactate transferase
MARVCVLAGGVGAARFLEGVVQVVPPEQVTAIVNTGDDLDFQGLYVAPDLDIVMYTLAGLVDAARGWGIAGDTSSCLEMLGRYGEPTWFGLGDRDLATCLLRTRLLAEGQPLSVVTDRLRRALGVDVRLLPMSDQPVRTQIGTPQGIVAFQEYFVHRRQTDEVRAVHFQGIASAQPAPGVRDAIEQAAAIVIAPSNPFVSIGTILAVPGVRSALTRARERVIAVTPIIGGAAVKGPAAAMLASLGSEVSAAGVAALYQDIAANFVLDEVDAALAPRIEALGCHVVIAPTLMTGPAEKHALAACALRAVGIAGAVV